MSKHTPITTEHRDLLRNKVWKHGEIRKFCQEHNYAYQSAIAVRFGTMPTKVKGDSKTLDQHMSEYEINDRGCWVIQGNTPAGYKTICRGLNGVRRTLYAHRLAFQRAHGVLKDDWVVRHTCHNKSCINPEHLDVGTDSDNIIDSRRIGVGPAIITNGQAAYIIVNESKIKGRRGVVKLYAKTLGCHVQSIRAIFSQRTFKWLRNDIANGIYKGPLTPIL